MPNLNPTSNEVFEELKNNPVDLKLDSFCREMIVLPKDVLIVREGIYRINGTTKDYIFVNGEWT